MKENRKVDEQILEMINENGNIAFSLLYKEYWNRLLHFASHYLNDRGSCEEIIQELFIALHMRRDTLKISTSMSAYLYTALRNKILNYLRSQAVYRKHINIAASKVIRIQNSVEQTIYMKELQEEISDSLKYMPSKCKEVYLLHEREHFTVKRIAELLNRPIDTVEKQLRRAKKILKDYLFQYSYMPGENKSTKIGRSTFKVNNILS